MNYEAQRPKLSIIRAETRVSSSPSQDEDPALFTDSGSSGSRTFFSSVTSFLKPKARTVYIIEVVVEDRKWTVARRYSQFAILHERLTLDFPLISLPELPAKTVNLQFDEREIESRRLALESLLQFLLHSRYDEESADFRNFLCLSPDSLHFQPRDVHAEEVHNSLAKNDYGKKAAMSASPSLDPKLERRPSVNEASSKSCTLCGSFFTPLARRQTCKRCGNAVCSKCTQKVRLRDYGASVKICTMCVATVDEEEEMNQEHVEKLRQKMIKSLRMLTFLSMFDGGKGGKRIYIERFPKQILENATSSLSLSANDPLVLLIDVSKFGKAYQSIAFSVKGVYFNCDRLPKAVGRGFIEYSHITAMYPEDLDNLHVSAHKMYVSGVLRLCVPLVYVVVAQVFSSCELAALAKVVRLLSAKNNTRPSLNVEYAPISAIELVEVINLLKDVCKGEESSSLTLAETPEQTSDGDSANHGEAAKKKVVAVEPLTLSGSEDGENEDDEEKFE